MTTFKKLSALVIVLLLALHCAACAGPSTPAATAEPAVTAAPASTPTAEPTPEPMQQPTGPFSPEGSVLFERDGVKVTTDGLDLDPSSGDADPIVWLKIENTGDRDLCLGVAEGVGVKYAENGSACAQQGHVGASGRACFLRQGVGVEGDHIAGLAELGLDGLDVGVVGDVHEGSGGRYDPALLREPGKIAEGLHGLHGDY